MSNAFAQVPIIWLAVLSCGMSTTFFAIGLPALSNSGVDLSPTQVSVVGTVRQVGVVIGALIIGPILDNWGRRKGMLASIIPGIAGFGATCVDSSVALLCVTLALSGVAMGMTTSSASVYFAEAMSIKWRGVISVSRNVVMSLGLTFTYILGYFIKDDIKLVALVALLPPSLAFLLGMGFLEETNVWADQTDKEKKSFGASYSYFWSALKVRPEVYKPFIILNCVNFLRNASGIPVITNYTINIITDTGATIDPYKVAVALGVFRTVGGLISALLCSFFKRRVIMLYTGILMTLGMVGLAALQYFDKLPKLAPEVLLILFITTSVIFVSIYMSLQGEIYPTEYRGMCNSITMTISHLQAGLVLFAYPLLKSWFGSGYILMIYAVASACCVAFTFLMIPDTDDKTLDEIGQLFGKTSEEANKDVTVSLNRIEPKKNIYRRRESECQDIC